MEDWEEWENVDVDQKLREMVFWRLSLKIDFFFRD